jgi:hypothetical protein
VARTIANKKSDREAPRHMEESTCHPNCKYQAKTPLGRRLWELRTAIVHSDAKLLNWEEIEREVRERRGGQDQEVR